MGDIEKDINSKFPNEHLKALININYTSNWLDTLGNRILKPFNISMQQYNVLRILRGAQDQITVNTVKDRMIQKSPNTTRLMDKLCDKKLIERTRCTNDRRIVYIKITNLGLDILMRINIEELNNHMKAITEKEAKTLNNILDKIR